MPAETLKVNEVFCSIQGESSYAGLRCVFVRLTGCHLRCRYCDTEYAFYEGQRQTVEEIVEAVGQWDCDLVEITGGEPLLQRNVYPLMSRLADEGRTVLLETSGCIDVSQVDERVIKVMDFKCPSSGEADKNLFENVHHLHGHDEVKFVMGNRADYDWTKSVMERYGLAGRCLVLVSPVFGELEPVELAGWVLADRLPVRMQVQLHKVIWSPEARGV